MFHPYPDALNTEIMDPSATVDHTRACGAWLGSGTSVQMSMTQKAAYLSSAERAERRAEIDKATSASVSSTTTNIGKLWNACHRAVLGGGSALRASAELAYRYIVRESGVDGILDEASMLAATGMLVSYYCDGPVKFGMIYNYYGVNAAVRAGVSFKEHELAHALHIVGESTELQQQSELGNAHVNAFAWNSPQITKQQLEDIFVGGTGRRGGVDRAGLQLGITPEMNGLLHLTNSSLVNAKAYLKGVAAQCSLSLERLISSTVKFPGDFYVRRHRDEPRAAGLGRLHRSKHDDEPLAEGDINDLSNASFITLGQLTGYPSTNPRTACLELVRMLMPDRADALSFDAVIPQILYERMHSTVEVVRSAVRDVLLHDTRIRGVVAYPDEVAEKATSCKIRIPGAPRGSWAGSPIALPDPEPFTSSDGVFVMAAKAARGLWLARQRDFAYDFTTACDAPYGYTALIENAFIFPTRGCSFYYLGMSDRPWADRLYTDESLFSRFGAIIAHEMAHLTLNYQLPVKELKTFLTHYPGRASTYPEAIADVIAALAILRTNMTTPRRFCLHWSQSWCARTPLGYESAPESTHPKANVRGDALCETLRDLGFDV
jgi:hypothetical protein